MIHSSQRPAVDTLDTQGRWQYELVVDCGPSLGRWQQARLQKKQNTSPVVVVPSQCWLVGWRDVATRLDRCGGSAAMCDGLAGGGHFGPPHPCLGCTFTVHTGKPVLTVERASHPGDDMHPWWGMRSNCYMFTLVLAVCVPLARDGDRLASDAKPWQRRCSIRCSWSSAGRDSRPFAPDIPLSVSSVNISQSIRSATARSSSSWFSVV